MAKTRTINRFNAFLMVMLILFWGSSFVVVKIALSEGLTPVAIATFRFLVAGVFFAALLILRKARNSSYSLSVNKRDAPRLVALAFLGITFFFTAQYTGIQMAGASIAAILVCLLSPILIAVLSAIMFKEHVTRMQSLGVGIAALGTLTVIMGGFLSFAKSTDFLLGSLILLSTPFLWAAYTLLGRRIMESNDAFVVVAYVNMLGGLFLVPFSAAENSLGLALKIGFDGWLSILYLALTCSVLGYYIWFYVLKQEGPVVTSSFLFAEPLITVLFAVTFAGEQVNLFILGGGLLIFTGVYLVSKKN